jgi:hypothetical protein
LTQKNSGNSPNTSKPTYKTSLTLTISDLEQRAANLLNAAFPQGAVIPVDIEFLAENHLGLRIFPCPGLETAFGVFGVFVKRRDAQFDLVIDEDIMDRQPLLYRFTIGEEIGHYILHRDHFSAVQTVEDACKVYATLEAHHVGLDRNARWFSSALLMPSEQIKNAAAGFYRTMVQAAGFNDHEAVLHTLTATLAKTFCVSSAAMGHRLKNFPCHVYDAARAALKNRSADLG